MTRHASGSSAVPLPASGPPDVSAHTPFTPPPCLDFTPAQRQAIETIDRSVLVSAAAGSGKTSVLAERCAYLVADAPGDQRCGLDELLVVTFTENAAAEMKDRIRKALRGRLARDPGNHRLREQLDRLDAARISTLHAFGLWVLRRAFNEAGIDPAAPLLDEHEALLLRTETLDALFERCYAAPNRPATAREGPAGAAFRELVERYGLTHDRPIRGFVLKLAAFLDSLPDPGAWLNRAVALVTDDRAELLSRFATWLAEELDGQIQYCQSAAAHIAEHLRDFNYYGDLLEQAAERLSEWRLRLPQGASAGAAEPLATVQAEVAAHKFSTTGAPRVASDAPEEIHERRDRARELWGHFKDDLFNRRLQRTAARYTPAQWFDGLDRIAPQLRTVVELVEVFRRDYAAAKAEAGVLDFADLERRTYELLISHPEVAADLRRRFRHVLVDEFQDINPLQEAILRWVSREGDAAPGNLFVVGDVKQSIYRFRLAEPAIFLQRMAELAKPGSAGACIALQENYRSDAGILEAVNEIFRRIMVPQVGGIAYDGSAELRPGGAAEPATEPSVELHLLERQWTAAEGAVPDQVDPDDPAEWSAIQREAWLIAERIRAFQAGVGADRAALRFRDVAILLRAASNTAAPLARMLTACGIPARADVGGEFFTAVEVQDVLSLLAVLDNPQQDVPLAAVLRAPILGEPYSEDDLVEIRCLDRMVPFHEAVRRYAAEGPLPALRAKLANMLRRLARDRDEARQRPLADTLWRHYHEHGYCAWVGGLPDGGARTANLLKLHELARRFGGFQRQGLHRFLRFLDALREQEVDLGSAPALSAAEDVVRVMSVHRSKGLEFPVVFLADLGRRFNTEDASRAMIYDRDMGLGLRTVDPERMIEYPSLAHFLVSARVHLHVRAEELRVLYVALTRAKHRLVMIGSGSLERFRRDHALHEGHEGPLSPLAIRTASTPLDWIVPALGALPPERVRRPDTHSKSASLLVSVRFYDEAAMQTWSLQAADAEPERATRRAAARMEPLPAHEPCNAPAEVVQRIMDRLTYVYPHLADASVPAVIAATELAKGRAWLVEPGEQGAECGVRSAEWRSDQRSTIGRVPHPFGVGDASPDARFASQSRKGAAMEAGVATHRLLQHMDFSLANSAASLRDELKRLTDQGRLLAAESAAIDLDSVAWFLKSDLGRRLREAGADYRRELMFLAKWPNTLPEASAHPKSEIRNPKLPDSFALVRGVIDGVLATAAGLEIIDYKTDRIAIDQVRQRSAHYAPQLTIYAEAAAALYRKPVTAGWLVFLCPRESRMILPTSAAQAARPRLLEDPTS